MPSKRPDIPKWTQCALKGIGFWVGHRRELYRHHPLAEGALVGELCNLIATELGRDQQLDCEIGYRHLLKSPRNESDLEQSMSRADLVIFDRPVEGEEDYFDQCKSIIEVKRVQSAKKRIDKDLKRLAEAQKFSRDETRTFLVLVSQSQRPSRFTTKDGNARKGDLKIEDTNKKYWVRRSCKATSSFKGTDTAHYGCLLEVPGQPT